MRMSVFRSAITGADGSVDPGYLAMFWGLVIYSVSSIATVLLGARSISDAGSHEHANIIQSIGVALGAEAGGFATLLGAVGLFRMGDRPHPNTTTVSSSSVEVKAP